MLLRSRFVVPVSAPPIENGAVAVSDGSIVAVGRWDDLKESVTSEVRDLGESILLPGLINAHCHLDYTGLAGTIAPPKGFVDWIAALLALKAQWSYSEFAKSWIEGAQMLVRNGVTAVADIEAVQELLPDAWHATPLRVFSFLEMTGVRSQRVPEDILREAVRKIESLPLSLRCRVGLSPHAPYSTPPALLRLGGETARQRGWRITTHVAESEAEFEMFANRRGPLFDWLKTQRDMSDCGIGSPVQHLARCGLLGANLLAVHANCVAGEDACLLAESGTHVVHCPRSHDYFRHPKFPAQEMRSAGVNICLGTDSLASTRRVRGESLELDLLAEMRAVAQTNPSFPPSEILQMATVNAAQALGMSGQIGELSTGACADLIVIPAPNRREQIFEAALHHSGAVAASMINGQWAVIPPA